MTNRTTRKTVTFQRPFCLSVIYGILPSGTYMVDTVEELSLLAYRRIATLLHLPSVSTGVGVCHIVSIDPVELEAALKRDIPELL